MSNSPLKRSGMARVSEGSHSFTCHRHAYPQVERTILAFTELVEIFVTHPDPTACPSVKTASWPAGWLAKIINFQRLLTGKNYNI